MGVVARKAGLENRTYWRPTPASREGVSGCAVGQTGGRFTQDNPQGSRLGLCREMSKECEKRMGLRLSGVTTVPNLNELREHAMPKTTYPERTMYMEQYEGPRIEEGCLRDLRGLALFICAEQHGSVTLLLEMVRESYGKIYPVRPAYKAQALRRQLITSCITHFQDELTYLFRFYRNATSRQRCEEPGKGGLVPVHDGVCLHHRLLMLMVFREAYAIRDCALLLKIDEDLVREVCDEALTLLSPMEPL
jgi:hypothetical protein